MSTVSEAASIARYGEEPRRPGYWQVLRSVLWAQVLGYVSLWGLCVPLSFLTLFGATERGLSPYLPWVLSGPWSILAAAGWATLVVALIAALVRGTIANSLNVEIARLWTVVAVALGGYLPWLLHSPDRTKVLASAVLTPLLLRTLAFDDSGNVRRAPSLTSRKLWPFLVPLTLLLVVPYSLTHPFIAQGESGGSGMSNGVFSDTVRVGHGVTIDSGIAGSHFTAELAGVSLYGETAGLQIVRVRVSATPFDGRSLSFRLPATAQRWIALTIKLRSCATPPLTISGLRLRYRMFGLSLAQKVALVNPVQVTCRSDFSG